MIIIDKFNLLELCAMDRNLNGVRQAKAKQTPHMGASLEKSIHGLFIQ